MGLQEFIAAYVECALWASNDESNDNGGEPMDKNYSADDIAPEALATITAECAAFYNANVQTWSEWWTDERAGHDFWLTRNGHGAGFWDRFSPHSNEEAAEAGDKLSEAARAARERNLYVGDDGLIYIMHG